MINNYFLITLRSMLKNKLFVMINVFGMGIAIACSILGYLTYQYDSTFDTQHKNRESIYRVSAIREFEGKDSYYGFVPMPLGSLVKTFKDVDHSSRYYFSWSNFKRDNELFFANLAYADPDLFQMFTFDFINGKASDLSDRNSVFVSEEMAVKLFRTPEEAFGKTMMQVIGNETKEIKIAGVFRDPPMNSSFYKRGGSAYLNFDNLRDEQKQIRDDDWLQKCTVFIQILDGGRVEAIHRQLQPYLANNNAVREDFKIREFTLDPFPAMAHADRSRDAQSWTWQAPPFSAIVGSMVMGLLILLISCFNLTNTAIAMSSQRLKEIGIRKVMGGKRKQLVAQFIGETGFICFLALLLGLALADLLIGGWNLLWAYMHLTPHYLSDYSFPLFLAAVLFFTAVVAGSYPAFYISKFEPITILKGKLKFGGTNYFTRTLLGLQFAITMIAIVSAIGFIQNARYQNQYDMGFDSRGSIMAWLNDPKEFDPYKNSLQANPDIVSIAGVKSGIFADFAHEPVKNESKQLEVDIIQVGDNYLKTMDFKLIDGRDFIKDSKTDQKESIIITDKIAKLFGWEKPIGKELIWKDTVKLYVVGVIKDVYTRGLWREMEPMMIRYIGPEKYTQMVVSTHADKVTSVDSYMHDRWGELFSNRLYNGRMNVDSQREVNEVNLNIIYMYTFLGAVALMLSVTGLFTLLSLNIIKRTKEIGIRKVLGASVSNITRIVNTEFVIILVSASALGSWAGLTMTNLLMSTIWKYYQTVNVLTVAASITVLFTVAFCAIGYKIIALANMNPVNTLRDE